MLKNPLLLENLGFKRSFKYRTHIICAISLTLSLTGCGQDIEQNQNSTNSLNEEKESTFQGPEQMGELQTRLITEASGIAVSKKHDGSIWVHNDSGNEPFIFLINQDARLEKRFFLRGIENRDWEDMAIGPGPVPDQQYIYLADIGDNLGVRDQKTIYYFPEPDFSVDNKAQVDTIDNINAIHFRYPDGNHNAEAFLIDPITQNLYIVIKDIEMPALYEFPPDALESNEILTLQKCGEVEIETDNALALVTAGDIGANGQEVLLKTYGVVYYWRREDLDTNLCELLRSTPEVLNYTPEPQGEAIAFTSKQDGFFTLSEERFGKTPVLLFYPRK